MQSLNTGKLLVEMVLLLDWQSNVEKVLSILPLIIQWVWVIGEDCQKWHDEILVSLFMKDSKDICDNFCGNSPFISCWKNIWKNTS